MTSNFIIMSATIADKCGFNLNEIPVTNKDFADSSILKIGDIDGWSWYVDTYMDEHQFMYKKDGFFHWGYLDF